MKNVNHEKLNVLGNLSLSILSLCVSDALGEESGARMRTCVMSPFKEHFFLFPFINLPPSPPPYANILNRYSFVAVVIIRPRPIN